MTKGVVVPVAQPTRPDPSAAITSASAIRARWPQVRLRRAPAEIRVTEVGSEAMAMPAPRLVVGLRRARAAPAVQTPQDTAPTVRPRRPIGAVVAVIQRA